MVEVKNRKNADYFFFVFFFFCFPCPFEINFPRSDFVTLPFQGTEVLLDNLLPLPGTVCFFCLFFLIVGIII